MATLNVNFETTLQAGTTLKKYFKEAYGMAVKVNKVGTNTTRGVDDLFIEVRVADYRSTDTIPNEFRALCLAAIGGEALDPNNIHYGNIRFKDVAIRGAQWRKVFEVLNTTK